LPALRWELAVVGRHRATAVATMGEGIGPRRRFDQA